MFYITKVEDGSRGYTSYWMFESLTKSYSILDINSIRRIIGSGMSIENVKLTNGEAQITEVFNLNARRSDVKVLIEKTENNEYKLRDINGETNIYKGDYIVNEANKNRIVNAKIDDKFNLVTLDKCIESVDKELKDKIDSEYRTYILKSKLMGQDTGFDYSINSNGVLLEKYRGTSKHVVLPNFITTIAVTAFYNSGIKSIKLNHGLKYIGYGAFDEELEELILPDTIEFIMGAAIMAGTRVYMGLSNGDKQRISSIMGVLSNKFLRFKQGGIVECSI